jgi:hypothetical protein
VREPAGWRLRFLAIAGRSYSVENRPALSEGAWIKLTDIAPGAQDGTVEVLDPDLAGSTRYYRLLTPSPILP